MKIVLSKDEICEQFGFEKGTHIEIEDSAPTVKKPKAVKKGSNWASDSSSPASRTKLTDEDRAAIAEKLALGEKPGALAEEYGVSYPTILSCKNKID